MRAVTDRLVSLVLADRRGVSAVEYGILLASIFLVIVLGAKPITNGIRDFLLVVSSAISPPG